MVRRDAAETQKALIEQAVDIFAAKSYHDATVEEICRGAGANVAAVNYHFGNKENLYKKAWLYAFNRCQLRYPPDGGVAQEAPAAERLRGRIQSLVSKILGSENQAFAIMQRDLAEPTGLLRELVEENVQPVHGQLSQLVAELLGPGATKQQVFLCKNSILGQCFHLPICRKLHSMHSWLCVVDYNDVTGMSEYIYNFSLGGIMAIREQIAAQQECGSAIKE